MRRFERRILENIDPNTADERYYLAYKRMKRIKGFYVHLFIYIVVNIFIIADNKSDAIANGEVFWRWESFSTALFWGIGVMAHGLSVYSRNILFGTNWEERKIRQLMEREKDNKWE